MTSILRLIGSYSFDVPTPVFLQVNEKGFFLETEPLANLPSPGLAHFELVLLNDSDLTLGDRPDSEWPRFRQLNPTHLICTSEMTIELSALRINSSKSPSYSTRYGF